MSSCWIKKSINAAIFLISCSGWFCAIRRLYSLTFSHLGILRCYNGKFIFSNNNRKKKKKKRPCRIVDFAVPADHRGKLKEYEKRGKYLDLARELKKLWNMKVTIIQTVIGALGTVIKGLVQGLEDLEITGRVDTIQATVLLRSARIPRRVLETWGDLFNFKLPWETIN